MSRAPCHRGRVTPIRMDLHTTDELLDGRLALSVAEVADLLGLSVRTVRKCVADGDLPSVKFAGSRLIPCDAVRDLLTVDRSRQDAAA